MKFIPLSFFTIVCILSYTAATHAGTEILACGAPVETTLDTNPNYTVCNIYDRQLAYREKRLDFVRQIEERQANFAEPYLALQRDYKDKLQELHDSIE